MGCCRRNESCCGRHRDDQCGCRDEREHGGECECGCDCGEQEGDECCCRRDRHHGFRRRYQSKAEVIAELESYLAELKAEAQAVEERLGELRR